MTNLGSSRSVRCGPVAVGWLRRSNPMARVHSVFERVINLRSSDDRLISLTTPDVPMHPFSVGLDHLPPRDRVQTDQRVRFENGRIEEETGAWTRALGPLRTWDPGWPGHFQDRSLNVLRDSFLEYARRIEQEGRSEGLGPLADSISADPPASRGSPRFEAPLPKRAFRLLCAMERTLIEGPPEKLSSHAVGLAGLGPGLTPSGDDALRGWIAALWFTEGVHRSRDIAPLVDQVVDSVVPRTTWFSRQWIFQAGRRRFASPVRRLLRCLAGGLRGTPLQLAVKNVCRQGETSGLDLAVGLTHGLRACLRRKNQIVP